MTEDEFKNNILELAKTLGWLVHHDRPARTKHGWVTPIQGDKGFPDLVLSRKGITLYMELKSETGKLTDEQAAWLREIDPQWPNGGTAFVFRPSDIQVVADLLATRGRGRVEGQEEE